MAPRKGNKEQSWRRLLTKWQHSGLTIRAFCAKHQISEPSFYFWKRTLLRRDQQASPPVEPDDRPQPQPLFIPLQVVPTPPAPTAMLEVILDRRFVLRVPPGFDAATLRQLLALLQEPSC